MLFLDGGLGVSSLNFLKLKKVYELGGYSSVVECSLGMLEALDSISSTAKTKLFPDYIIELYLLKIK
jgi:hypothetical protein